MPVGLKRAPGAAAADTPCRSWRRPLRHGGCVRRSRWWWGRRRRSSPGRWRRTPCRLYWTAWRKRSSPSSPAGSLPPWCCPRSAGRHRSPPPPPQCSATNTTFIRLRPRSTRLAPLTTPPCCSPDSLIGQDRQSQCMQQLARHFLFWRGQGELIHCEVMSHICVWIQPKNWSIHIFFVIRGFEIKICCSENMFKIYIFISF